MPTTSVVSHAGVAKPHPPGRRRRGLTAASPPSRLGAASPLLHTRRAAARWELLVKYLAGRGIAGIARITLDPTAWLVLQCAPRAIICSIAAHGTSKLNCTTRARLSGSPV